MNVLTLNAGSNSLKFEIVALEPQASGDSLFGSSVLAGVYDNIGKKDSIFALLDNKRPRDQQGIEIRDHGHATELLLKWIEEGHAHEKGIAKFADMQRVGHRVVHGADDFRSRPRLPMTLCVRLKP